MQKETTARGLSQTFPFTPKGLFILHSVLTPSLHLFPFNHPFATLSLPPLPEDPSAHTMHTHILPEHSCSHGRGEELHSPGKPESCHLCQEGASTARSTSRGWAQNLLLKHERSVLPFAS